MQRLKCIAAAPKTEYSVQLIALIDAALCGTRFLAHALVHEGGSILTSSHTCPDVRSSRRFPPTDMVPAEIVGLSCSGLFIC